jgi:hypothetical protein
MEAEIFESVSEAHRGERSIEDSEQRLSVFTEKVIARGVDDQIKLKLPQSREALETFLKMNHFILNVKKVCGWLS